MRKINKKLCLSVLVFLLCILAVPQTLQAAAKKPNASIRSYSVVGAGTAGYEIGTGKKVKLQAKTYIGKSSFKGTMRLRIRILNSKNKYVYQKYWTIKKSGTGTVNWNGKPSAGNAAKLSTAAYVAPGDYKVEFVIRYKASGSKSWKNLSKKTASLKVIEKVQETEKETESEQEKETETKPETNTSQNNSGTTVSGTSVFEGAKFTGNKDIDYIAEQMIQAAGVKPGMSDDERVKLIYHFMTVNFKHVHYNKTNDYTVYYKVGSAKVKKLVDAYYAETQQLYKDGKITNGKVSSSILWNMKRRIGECNHHALIFKILCWHAGVDSGVCKGYYINMNGTRAGHYWNYAVVNGKRYYYDVDVEIQNYGGGQGDYYWYKDDRAKAEKRHQFVSEE